MKKLFTVLTTLLLVLASCFTLVACGDNFEGTSMKNWGEIKQGATSSFIAETENYIYYINGLGTTTDDNKFGTPVKGALMVAEKSTFGTDNVKTEVVVPKIIITEDDDAGIYLFGSGENTYAYYGSPNVNKDSSGKVANTEMTFMRTRLDSKKSEELFSIDSHSTEYRMVEVDGTVFIVYYDATNKEVKSFNCSTKKATVVAKTDEETTSGVKLSENGNTVYTSLSEYKMLANGEKYQVAITKTVYTENYYSAKAEKDGYSRATASYNVIYLYSANSEPVLFLNGENTNTTYAVKYAENGYIFYSATDIHSNVKNYAVKLDNLEDVKEINTADLFEKDIIVESLDKVYVNDEDNSQVYTTSLIASAEELRNAKQKVVSSDDVTSLIEVFNGYLYVFDGNNNIARIKIGDADAEQELVSNGVASTTWYAPKFVEINGVNYLFYLDNADTGLSYVNYVNVDKEAVAVYEDEEETEVDYYTLEGQTFIGKMIDSDIVKSVTNKIDAIGTSALEFEEAEDGTLTCEAVTEARNAYDALSSDLKEDVSSEELEKLTKSELAIKLVNKYAKLSDVDNYSDYTDEQKASFKTLYEEAYNLRDEIVQNGEEYYTYVRDLISSTYKYYYQEAVKLFNTED